MPTSRLNRPYLVQRGFGVCLLLLVLFLHADSHEEAAEGTTAPISDNAPQQEEVGELDQSEITFPEGVSIERGKALSAPCVACHGDDGNTQIPEYSNIAGQNEKYLMKQLKLIQSKEREIVLMVGQLDNFNDDDLQSLARYYSSLTPIIGQANPDNLALGEAIYRGGIKEKNIAACTACHAPQGTGNLLAGFPRVSGQTVPYLINTLNAYRSQTRTSDDDVGGMMRDIAKNLSDEEIAAVANYMTSLY